MGLLQLRDSEIKAASSGKLNDGGGLFIRMTGKGRGFWVFRYSWHGQRPEMGLGAYPETSLREARAQAERWRAVRKEGKNPMDERDTERRALSQAVPTLEGMFLETFEALKPDLKDGGKAGRWDSPVRLHILPKLGQLPIDRLTQRDLERALKPIWTDKPDVARKALNRVNLTLKRAAAGGYDVDMQIAQKARALLGAQRIERTHIPSMPWGEVPAFYQSLGDEPPSHLALRFLILTGLRTKTALNLSPEHRTAPDLIEVPPALMKSGRPFRVPLSSEAQRVLDLAQRFARGGLFFPGLRNKPLSDMTLTRILERHALAARPHGFRSSLIDWLAERTEAPWEVRETMLDHKVGSAVSQAYERTDYLDQRRALLERWGRFVTSSEPASNVLRFGRSN